MDEDDYGKVRLERGGNIFANHLNIFVMSILGFNFASVLDITPKVKVMCLIHHWVIFDL